MNDSNVFAEMLIEVGRITNELRNELSNTDYLLKRSEEEQKKLSESTEKYRREIFTGQKSIEEWKSKYEALNKEKEMLTNAIESYKEHIKKQNKTIFKLRKRKK